MNESNDGAMMAICFFVTVALGVAYGAYKSGDAVTAPPVKSDRELCVERGGVYVLMRYGPNRCFAPEAFKEAA